MKSKNPLDFYKNEKEFLMVDHAISAYFPLNPYAEKRKMAILSTFEEKFADRDDIIYTVDFMSMMKKTIKIAGKNIYSQKK